MKAVVWTDTFQSFLMIGGQIALIIIGSVKVGGMDEVWRINHDWGRLDVQLNPDPTIRLTLWSAIIGGTFLSKMFYYFSIQLASVLTVVPLYENVAKDVGH